MGQKVNPNFLRMNINTQSNALWFAKKKHFADYLNQDLKIRDIIKNELKNKQISDVTIARGDNKIKITISAVAPPLVMGKNNANIKKIVAKIKKEIKKTAINISVIPIKNPNVDAQIVADHIAHQLENRVSFRYAQKSAIKNSISGNIAGIRTQVSGRLNGADMARREWYSRGQLTLHTFKSRISYASAKAITTYGCIGVKVWIYHKEPVNKSHNLLNNRPNNWTGKDKNAISQKN